MPPKQTKLTGTGGFSRLSQTGGATSTAAAASAEIEEELSETVVQNALKRAREEANVQTTEDLFESDNEEMPGYGFDFEELGATKLEDGTKGEAHKADAQTLNALEELEAALAGAETTGTIMELLPFRWGDLDPKTTLDRIALAHHVSGLPHTIQNEILFLRGVGEALFSVSRRRWEADKIDVCADATAWTLCDLLITIALRMEFSYCDMIFIKSVLSSSRESLRAKEKGNYKFIYSAQGGWRLWNTLIQWTKQVLKKEDAAKRSSATTMRGGRGGGFNPRGRGGASSSGSGGAFRGGKSTPKL